MGLAYSQDHPSHPLSPGSSYQTMVLDGFFSVKMCSLDHLKFTCILGYAMIQFSAVLPVSALFIISSSSSSFKCLVIPIPKIRTPTATVLELKDLFFSFKYCWSDLPVDVYLERNVSAMSLISALLPPLSPLPWATKLVLWALNKKYNIFFLKNNWI